MLNLANSKISLTNNLSLDHLKTSVDLRDLAAHCWGAGQRRGKAVIYNARWRPDDDTPSFAVYADGYYDYGTGEHGSVIDFVMQENNLNFQDALEWLARYSPSAYAPADRPQKSTEKRANDEPPSAIWQHAAQKLAEDSQAYLWSDHADAQSALHYLRLVRGLDDATIRAAGLGYNPRWQRTDIVKEDGKNAYLAPGIVIPYRYNDAIWALRVRSRIGDLARALGMPEDTGRSGKRLSKYINLYGSKVSGTLYQPLDLDTSQTVVIVEGEFDALLAAQTLGDAFSVCTLGGAANRLTGRWQRVLDDAPCIVLMLDQDAAGQHATDSLQEQLNETTKVASLPPNMDVTDYVKSGGDLLAVVQGAQRGAWWASGMPDSWRSTLLTYTPAAVASLIELTNRALNANLINADSFTVNDLVAANRQLSFGMADSSLRRAFVTCVGLFFSRLHTESLQRAGCKSEKNTGRPAEWFTIRPLADVRETLLTWIRPRLIEKHFPVLDSGWHEALLAYQTPAMMAEMAPSAARAALLARKVNVLFLELFKDQEGSRQAAMKRYSRDLARITSTLERRHSTPLPDGWALGKTRDYRAAFLVATNDPDQPRSRRQIAELLGMSLRSVGAMVDYAGLSPRNPDGEFVERRVTASDDLTPQVARLAKQVKGFPCAVVAHLPSGETVERRYDQGDRHRNRIFVQSCAARGATVAMRFQTAHRYVIARHGPPPPPTEGDESPLHYRDAPPPPENDTMRQRRTHLRRRVSPLRVRRPKKHYGPSHDPAWIAGQIQLGLRLSGWQRPNGRLIHPETGEVMPRDVDLRSLLLLLFGEKTMYGKNMDSGASPPKDDITP